MNRLQASQRMMREMAQQLRVLIAGSSVQIPRRILELPSQLEQEADLLGTEIRDWSPKSTADEWRCTGSLLSNDGATLRT